MFRKYLFTLAAIAALALALAGAAGADPPTRTYLPAAPFSGHFCPGFDVLVTPLVDREYATTFDNGAVIITGRLVLQVTNLSTGDSIVVNASGPGFVSDDGTTLTFRGNTAVFDAGGLLYPGSPPDSLLFSGVLVFDPSGVTQTGTVRDLCTELA